ncbi:hypothetical protein [Pandoraea anapnoica]|uniref:hypothetical protein n=1 Tax=Pandoraea anapnoica TaxID=2508301 RepID=UPI00123F4864|nr:hypothetical protein [Pandoraea anapnoica]
MASLLQTSRTTSPTLNSVDIPRSQYCPKGQLRADRNTLSGARAASLNPGMDSTKNRPPVEAFRISRNADIHRSTPRVRSGLNRTEAIHLAGQSPGCANQPGLFFETSDLLN